MEFKLIFLFGLVLVFMLFVFEDGISFAIPKKLLCRLGYHKMKVRKTHKYYCQYCKLPRKHPKLKAIDGGNKVSVSRFDF